MGARCAAGMTGDLVVQQNPQIDTEGGTENEAGFVG
jgi:hypothetical protein